MHPRRYETLILLSSTLTVEQVEAFKGKVDGILATGHGQLVRFEDWGRRRLAYPVRKEIYGYYLLYDFQAQPNLAAELERNLKIDEQVYKYLTLILDKNFTDERLTAEKERLVLEANRREAEKNQPRDEEESTDSDDNDDDDDDNEIIDNEGDE